MRICKTILAAALLTAATVMGTSAANGQDPASCTPSGTTVSCTIEAIVTPDVPSRTVTVRLLGQDVITVTTPAVNTPNTAEQDVVASITQTGDVVGHLITECSAQVSVTGGTAVVSVSVNGTTLASTSVLVPAAGEILFIDAC